MKIHHLNCGTDCPLGGPLFDGRSVSPVGHLVCHCLLIESDHGLILVDTGYGLNDVRHPHGHDARIPIIMRAMLGIQLREEETAIRQIEALGFRAADVRHIVLTHLDFDHAGGLDDFPNAAVHVMHDEYRAATGRRSGFQAQNRYRPAQFRNETDWRLYDAPSGERWFGFDAVRQLDDLPPDILLVPMPGHTWGHAAVAVRTEGRWFCHAGDAYFYHGEMRQAERHCTPGLRFYQNLMQVDRDKRMTNQERLRRLSIEHRDDVTVACAHDVTEFEACVAGRAL